MKNESLSDLLIDLMDEIERGDLTFAQIASKYNVPLSWVYEANSTISEIGDDRDEY